MSDEVGVEIADSSIAASAFSRSPLLPALLRITWMAHRLAVLTQELGLRNQPELQHPARRCLEKEIFFS
jgi:hypothetical protein